MDTISKKERSKLMARVKAKNNKSTEVRLVGFFKKHRVSGWRRHQRIVGRPDFLFRKVKGAVFVDGCFWHGCPDCGRIPKNNRQFWFDKIATNRKRDLEVVKKLKSLGYKVVRIWECQLKNEKKVLNKIRRLCGSDRG